MINVSHMFNDEVTYYDEFFKKVVASKNPKIQISLFLDDFVISKLCEDGIKFEVIDFKKFFELFLKDYLIKCGFEIGNNFNIKKEGQTIRLRKNNYKSYIDKILMVIEPDLIL